MNELRTIDPLTFNGEEYRLVLPSESDETRARYSFGIFCPECHAAGRNAYCRLYRSEKGKERWMCPRGEHQ